MADQIFLNHLKRIRKTYRPNYMLKVTPVVLNEMEFNLKEIGRHLLSGDGQHAVMKCLDSLCRRALDLLGHPDYKLLFDEIVLLHSNKNAGYAGLGGTDPWANFRTARWFGITPFTGCLVRMGDKFIRIVNLSKNPAFDKVGEAITDTLQDLAVYSIIAMCLWEEEMSAILCDGGMYYDGTTISARQMDC
jgi:hypothetical protein